MVREVLEQNIWQAADAEDLGNAAGTVLIAEQRSGEPDPIPRLRQVSDEGLIGEEQQQGVDRPRLLRHGPVADDCDRHDRYAKKGKIVNVAGFLIAPKKSTWPGKTVELPGQRYFLTDLLLLKEKCTLFQPGGEESVAALPACVRSYYMSGGEDAELGGLG